MSFKIDNISSNVKSYVNTNVKNNISNSTLQIKTINYSGEEIESELIQINSSNFVAENADFVNGTVISGVTVADHAVFGASDGNRIVTTIATYNLLKGTYLSFSSVCGEAYGGSIELPEDPDGDEDLVIEVSTDNETFTRLLGRVTERNSSKSSYIENRFLMTENDGNYYIRITQTDHSGDGFDYYAFKNLKTNLNCCIFDPVNKINLF